jgi:conjugative relaxase-like TrwC/TraI family protein
MLTISHALSVSQAKDYYENEYSNGALVHADYYQEKGAPRGEWFGKLACEWGLVGDVTEEQFYRVIEGRDPNTGEQLVQHIEARKYLNKYGQEVETSEHRAGWDATFSMPKSLVILAYMSGDEKLKRAIWQAHINSVNKALVEMEKFACARIDGKWERSGNMIASLHHHERARPDEKTGYAAPEIHTHAVFMNMTRAGDGRLRAMQEIELFRSQAYLTAIYRTGLAEDVQKSGVELRVDLETGAPEVKEISREYIEAASVRSEEVKRKSAEIKERLEAEGHAVKDGAGLRQAAARLNRQGKDFDLEEMIRRDAELEEKFGFQAHRAREAARERGPILRTREEIEQRAGQAVTYGIETAMEREAVNDARLLMTKALQRNMALTTYEAVKAEMEAREASGELTKIERLQKMPERTTPRMLNLERGNIKTMLDGKGTQTPLASGQAAKSLIDEICYRQGITLNQDQYRAVMRLIESRDRIIALQGRAGAGKTTMMRVFREAAERAGFVVQGIAPTNIAAKQLRESGLRTNTLAQFVRSGRKKGEEGKRYFVIDESSLADTKRMNALLKRIGHQDRVQFVGDRDQYQAIEAGAPFEQFQRNGVEVVWLKQVVRQQDPQYREAVMLLQQGKIREAIDKFQAQGRIIEVKDDEERLAAVAELFVRNPENCLAVDPGNVGRVTTNAKVHKLLQQAGRVDSADHKTSILVNREDLTGADRKWAARYKPGADIVRYREGSKVYGVKKGEYGRVTAVDFEQNLLRVKFECGRSLTYNPERLYGVEVFREKQRDFAVGDRVQFRKETDDRKAANGELAVIERIEGKEFLMRLQNGHEVKVDTEKFRHFDYGYSVTSYLSQSQTSPEEIVNIDTKLGDVLVNERLSKVAFTRGVHNIVIVTNSVADLVGALERQKNKEIALDALKESEQLRDWKARGARAEGGEPSLSDQVEHRARAGREATSNELDRDGSREFERISLDPEIPENLPEPMYNRVILGEALVAGMRYEWAKLDTQAARDYGTAFRLRVRDESTGADRNISQLDVTRRAEARAGRTAARYRHAPGEDRRRIKEQLARQDIVYHGETMKAHSEALTGLVKQREEKEAQARAAHTEAAEQARSVTEKYHSRGEPEPVPYISRETLDRLEEEATRRGLTRQIETLENLREALAPEHGYAIRTAHEAARLAAQAMTARVEHQASLRRLTGFEHTRHTHRHEIDGKKWTLAELDRAIEKYSNQAKILDKYYNLHLDPRSRVAAAAEVERLSEIRQQVGERIKERSNDLAFKVEQSRQRAFVLQAAHEREKAIFISHGFEMPAPIFTSNELKRIEANLPAVGDVNLLRQLSQVDGSLDHVNHLGRALAREVIAEIKCHEAVERLQNFEKYGTRQALLIESPDGRLSTYRLQDVKLHSVIDRIFENKQQREIREKVERVSDAHHRRLIGECEKSFAYLQTARELAAEQRRAAGKSEVGISAIELTPAEKIRLEIFAEKRSDEGERRHYLRIARESSEHKTEYERRHHRRPKGRNPACRFERV